MDHNIDKDLLLKRIIKSDRLLAREKMYLEDLVNRSRWIPCSERMPRDDGKYLCFSNKCLKIMPYNNGEFYGICFDGVMRCANSSVTHWMILPEPPEKEEKE